MMGTSGLMALVAAGPMTVPQRTGPLRSSKGAVLSRPLLSFA